MTIFTSSGTTQEKKDVDLNSSGGYVKAETDPPADERPPPYRPSIAWSSNIPTEWQVVERRRRLLGGLCITLLIVWLLLAAVLGALVAYRYFNRRPAYYGWCGTTYFDDLYEGRQQHSGEPTALRSRRLKEKVEINPDQEYEKIEVPEFGPNRPATFIHDFKLELTAIVDLLGGQCFLKRLDRQTVNPPSSFMDLIKKMESGYYGRDARVVRETYRVGERLTPDAVNALGSWMIKNHCLNKNTFELRRVSHALERDEPLQRLPTTNTAGQQALAVEKAELEHPEHTPAAAAELARKLAIQIDPANKLRSRRAVATAPLAKESCKQFAVMSAESTVNIMNIC